jgi:hypothetical protein
METIRAGRLIKLGLSSSIAWLAAVLAFPTAAFADIAASPNPNSGSYTVT